MLRLRKTLILGSSILLSVAGLSEARTIAFDPFNTTSSSGAADPENGLYWAHVDGASGSLGGDANRETKNGGIIGFGDHPWEENATTARPQNATLSTANRSAGDGGVRVLNFKGSSGAPSTSYRAAWRDLNAYTPESTYYMSGVFQIFTAPTGNAPGAFLMAGFGDELVSEEETMWENPDEAFEGLLVGFRANEAGNRIDLVLRATIDRANRVVEDRVLVEGVQQQRNYFVALRVDIDESGPDLVTVWVDPLVSVLGEEPSGGMVFETEAFSSNSSITRFSIQQAGLLHTSGNNAINRVGYFDAPTLGTTYASVIDSPALFYQTYGSGAGQSAGETFDRNLPDEWTLEADALRLSAANSDYAFSAATVPMGHYNTGDDFGLRSEMTLRDLSENPAENAVGHVVLADTGAADPNSADFYFAQWLPNTSTGSLLRISSGATGSVLAETIWTGLHPSAADPSAGIGARYTLTTAGRHKAGGMLELLFRLTDEEGHSQTLVADISTPFSGTRFGLGARHRAGENPIWDFHDLGATDPWKVDFVSREAPFAYEFGSQSGQDNFDHLILAHPRPEAWTLTDGGLRFARQGGSWESSISAVSVENYQKGQDFAVETEMVLVQLENLELNRFGLAVLGSDHDPFGATFNPAADNSFYGLMWFPAPSLDDPSEIRIRQGFNGSTLASVPWTGLHPNINNQFEGIGTTYTFTATGVFDSDGALTLSFTLTDATGHSQTLETTIENPVHGRTFGIGGRTHGGQNPIAEFRSFGMEIGEAPAPDEPTFADWLADHFTAAELADEEIAGPSAAPSGDGISNLAKYVLNVSPRIPLTLSDITTAAFGDDGIELTYWERPSAADVGYSVQVSADLNAWQDGTGLIQEISRETVGELEKVTVRAETESERFFLRLVLDILP